MWSRWLDHRLAKFIFGVFDGQRQSQGPYKGKGRWMLLSGHLDLITLVNKGFMIYLKYFVSIRIKNDLSIFKRWEFISHCVLISLFHGEAINSENSFMFTPFSLSHATFCDIVKNNIIFVSLLGAIFLLVLD